MANTLLPIEERNLTPDEVEALDRRRRRGHLLLTIGFQCLIVSGLLSLWVGQDLTYGPPGGHLIFYWTVIVGVLAIVFLLTGLRLRRGLSEFISY